MKFREVSKEAVFAVDETVTLTSADIPAVKARCHETVKKRSRICAHRSEQDELHDMILALAHGTYIRPHKHPWSTESGHVIEGESDLYLFDDSGAVTTIIELGEYRSERVFFFRQSDPVYHTQIVRSETFVMHEVILGPFDKSKMVYADWAPEEDDEAEARAFMQKLARGQINMDTVIVRP